MVLGGWVLVALDERFEPVQGVGKGFSGRCFLVVRLLIGGSASQDITSEAEMAETGLVMRRRLQSFIDGNDFFLASMQETVL